MRKDALPIFFQNSRLSHGLCLLLILGLAAACQNRTEASTPAGISITSAGLSPAPAVTGQTVTFSASYTALPDTGMYMIQTCKTRRIATGGLCLGGSWCSSSFAGDNPAHCSFTAPAISENNAYYAFVCDNAGRCSAPYSGTFSVTGSALSLEAPSALNLGILPFSFAAQTSSLGSLGDLILTATNVSSSGWSVDISVQDWTDTAGHILDADGDGVTSGQLSVDLGGLSIDASDPAAAAGITPGVSASFSPSARILNLASAPAGSAGIFVIKGISFKQFLPAGQAEGDYKTVLVFTVS